MTATYFSRVPVARKLLLLVLIPCLLQAFFVCVLALFMRSAQSELRQAEHQRNALISLKATTGVAAIALVKIIDADATSWDEMRVELQKLDDSLRGKNGTINLLDSRKFPELKEIIEDAQSLDGELETLFKQAQANINKPGKKVKRVQFVQRALLLNTILNFQSLAKRIIAAEASTKNADVQQINDTQKTINAAILAVLGVNALITILFLKFFTSDIAARLKLVTGTAHRLGQSVDELPACPGSDEITALDTAFRDVSRRLEEYRKQKLAILDNAVDVVFSIDEKLKVEAVNNACFESWGYTAEDLLGRAFLSILAPSCRTSVSEQIQRFASAEKTESAIIEAQVLIPFSATIKTFEITLSRLSETPGFAGVARDITQEKAVAALKERLLAIVSHDLRTPLASLSITISVIVEGKRVADAELMKKLRAIDSKVQQLMNLTHDLLSLEKQELELANITFEPVKAYNIWLQAKPVLQPLCKMQNVLLVGPSSDVDLSGCEGKLVQAFLTTSRIVLNFCRHDAQLLIRFSSESGNGVIEIVAQELAPDLGPAHSIAERLKTVNDESLFTSENILLAIARAICQRHGGRLDFSGERREDAETLAASICIPLVRGVT